MSQVTSADAVHVHAPTLTEQGDRVRVSFPVEGLAAPSLWFDVDAEYRHWISHTLDAPLAALLIAAMQAGRDVVLHGPASPRLLWHVRNTVLPVAMRQLPFLREVRISATEESVAPSTPPGKAVLTGFSCGVDSLSALQDHRFGDRSAPADRVSYLLFSHVGHHGYGPEVDERAEQRWQRMRAGAQTLGLPIVRVSSNTPAFYPSVYNSPLAWAAALTLRNSAVPLLLQQGVRRFLFASSHSWAEVGVFPTSTMTKADPILLPALCTEQIELCAIGAEYTRVEKTRQIADMPLAQSSLDVCIMDGDGNCTRCEKCMRTALTLEILGALPAFSTRFDMAEYARRRTGFLAEVVADRHSSFLQEIQDVIRETGFPVPVESQLRASAIRAWRLLPAGVRRSLRG